MSEEDAPGAFVDPATVPELATILRAKLRAKVRLFDAFCEQGDRLVEVLRVRGRPLAITRMATTLISVQDGAPELTRTRTRHRAGHHGMWLDLPPEAYYAPLDRPLQVGESVERIPHLLHPECQHENVPVPGWWLRHQISSQVRRRLIDASARQEMGVRPQPGD